MILGGAEGGGAGAASRRGDPGRAAARGGDAAGTDEAVRYRFACAAVSTLEPRAPSRGQSTASDRLAVVEKVNHGMMPVRVAALHWVEHRRTFTCAPEWCKLVLSWERRARDGY